VFENARRDNKFVQVSFALTKVIFGEKEPVDKREFIDDTRSTMVGMADPTPFDFVLCDSCQFYDRYLAIRTYASGTKKSTRNSF
jgi:hypothetical protein